MFGVISSVLTGGATGLIGSLLSKGIGIFEAGQKRKDKALEYEQELKLLDKQAALRTAETENELAIANAETAASLREASYSHDNSMGKPHRWVVDVLRLVRPVLTGFLLILVGGIYFTTDDFAMKAGVIDSVLFMTSSAVTWWFGDRSLQGKK
mgnify:FL=1|jgi:hypothetical protein|tara:strand:- start:412 stop:870 length:459 start_codon:yes stop_codon:yes gene_type:complete